MATFCDIPNCSNLSFRTDRNTLKHYCSNHWRQYSTDIDKRSITAKALAKGKSENKPHKEPRFQKVKLRGRFDESVLNTKIDFVTPTPESFDGEKNSHIVNDEWGQYGRVGDGAGLFYGAKGSPQLEQWFIDRHAEFTGICKHCGGKSSKDDPKYWKFSVAHVLSKSLYPSVACHPLNALELCFWSPSCHKNYDDGMLPLTQLNCFDEAIMKIVAMYPFIDKKERRRLPDYIMQYIDTER